MLRWIIAALLAAVGLWAAYRSWRAAQSSKAAQEWSRVQGRVVESRVEEVQGYDSDNRPETNYQPFLAYEYEAGGVTRRGRNIDVTDETAKGSRKAAEKRLAAYPVGQAVQVLVDPANPERACLNAKADLNLFAPILFFALAIVTAAGVFGG